MAKGSRNGLHILVGFFDFVKDRAEELQTEMARRGEDRIEDIKDFIDDIIENLTGVIPSDNVDPEDEEFEKDTTLGSVVSDLDIKRRVKDSLENMGLATPEDLKDMSDKLERIARAIDNLD